jgi:GNAT superfamily N-acetyltransferase
MNFSIRAISPNESTAVMDLVIRVFHHDVAPHYPEEGIREFLAYATSDVMRERLSNGHDVLVAESNGEIVGMIELRERHHISLFFVSPEHQRHGIGKALFREAMQLCTSPDSTKTITVNSSPNAVEAYEQLGFLPTAPYQSKNGIGFVPMIRTLAPNE